MDTSRTAPSGDASRFGVLLRGHRLAAGLSQAELAERAGLSERAISDLERGARRFPYPTTVRLLARALNLGRSERLALSAAREATSVADVLVPVVFPGHGDGQDSGVGVARQRRSHNLPAQLSSFVGRHEAMADIRRLLINGRLLTLVGPGGIGKTRLALAVSEAVLADYSDGVWLVELTSLTEAALVAAAIAAVLGVRDSGQRLTDQLVEALRSSALLLVLDNCEHLVQTCAELSHKLLRSCRGLQILATSREPLGVGGEVVFRVPALALPEPPVAGITRRAEPTEAMRLFEERARAVDSTFRLSEHNTTAVAEVCRQLDGMPLAIELAAARVKVLTPAQIAARMVDRFSLLVYGSRTAARRQQTLRATVDWSYDLLTEPERTLFNRLSVFAGGCTLDAAEAICADAPQCANIGNKDVLDLMSHLVDRSLVVAAEPNEGIVRYRLLETLRHYASDRLRERGEDGRVRQRHRDWFLALAEAARLGLIGPQQREWLQCLAQEHDNLRSALAWSLSEPSGSVAAVQLAGALHRFWWRRGYLGEGRAWLQKALDRAAQLGTPVEAPMKRAQVRALTGSGILARAQGDYAAAGSLFATSLALAKEVDDAAAIADNLFWLGVICYLQGDERRAVALTEESLALWREAGDPWGTSWPLGLLADCAWQQGDYQRATSLQEERLRLATASGDKWEIATVYGKLGILASEQGQHDLANDLLEFSQDRFQELDDRESVAWAVGHLGRAARRRGNPVQAAQRFEQSLVVFHELRALWGVAECIEGLAEVAGETGQPARAVGLAGSAAALRAQLGYAPSPRESAEQERNLARARMVLGPARFDAEWEAGRRRTPTEAVAAALAAPHARVEVLEYEALPEAAQLTRRERDVARLVARGLANRQVALALTITERTTENHLGHIYAKLGLSSRTQLATWMLSNARKLWPEFEHRAPGGGNE